MSYDLDPDWVRPGSCFCVVRNGVWHVSALCEWHGENAHPSRMRRFQPLVRVEK